MSCTRRLPSRLESLGRSAFPLLRISSVPTRRTLSGLACVVMLPATMAGCGPGAAASSRSIAGDGGTADAVVETGDVRPAPVTGRHSFDIRAIVRPDPAKPSTPSVSMLPSADSFSLTLDADVPRFIVGGGGTSQVVPATTDDGITFRAAMPISTGRPQGDCSQGAVIGLSYESLEVTVSGTSLRGTGAGTAFLTMGDISTIGSFLADLTGGPDVTPPFLIPLTRMATSPFDDIQFASSEPLPATATARLISSDGSRVDLIPQLTHGDFPIIWGFSKPAVVLHTGGGYSASVDGTVDFAGNSGAQGASLRIGTFETPPLIPQDGFESAIGPEIGGATIIRQGSLLPPIGGTASAYIGTMGAPAPPGTSVGQGLHVRLARQTGGTKLRFSYRVVEFQVSFGFFGSVAVGSVDGPAARNSAFTQSMTLTQVMFSLGAFVSLSDVEVMEVALPTSTADEFVVSIEGKTFICGARPPGAGLLIDDLRIE
jgi:hypothetical protein